MITLATWNVNSLRARLDHVIAWLQETRPHILALQEIKLVDQFPHAALEAIGYTAVYVGQKAYNGVAIVYPLSATPHVDPTYVQALPGDPEDTAKRLLAMTIGGIRVVNVYVPNGGHPDDPKFGYKLDWLARLVDWVGAEMQRYPELVVLGDFNIAPADPDLHSPERWKDSVLTHPVVRQFFGQLLSLGLVDTFRAKHPDVAGYTWWDYRLAAFQRNWGLRIDHALMSPSLYAACVDCQVDVNPRRWNKPSDHAPVLVTLRSDDYAGFSISDRISIS